MTLHMSLAQIEFREYRRSNSKTEKNLVVDKTKARANGPFGSESAIGAYENAYEGATSDKARARLFPERLRFVTGASSGLLRLARGFEGSDDIQLGPRDPAGAPLHALSFKSSSHITPQPEPRARRFPTDVPRTAHTLSAHHR
jgi:hypothetical protein